MSQVIPLFANPGQTVTLVVQILNSNGDRIDGYVPEVVNVYFPDRTLADGFPQNMAHVDVGLYVFDINIPTGVIGTFIANVRYESDNGIVWQVFSINVARPFGNSSASPI